MHQTLLHAECWNWLHTTNPRHGSMIKVRNRASTKRPEELTLSHARSGRDRSR